MSPITAMRRPRTSRRTASAAMTQPGSRCRNRRSRSDGERGVSPCDDVAARACQRDGRSSTERQARGRCRVPRAPPRPHDAPAPGRSRRRAVFVGRREAQPSMPLARTSIARSAASSLRRQHHARTRARRKTTNETVISVEQCDAISRERLDELGLPRGDRPTLGVREKCTGFSGIR